MDKAWNDLQAFRTAQVKPEPDEKWIPLLSQFSEFGTEYQKWRVRELKPGFVVISVPGRKFWSSVMDPSCYAPAEHILV